MTSNNLLGSTSRNGAEWKKAWTAIARLAAARQASLQGTRRNSRSNLTAETAHADYAAPHSSETNDDEPIAPLDPAEYARAIAEIEQASAALRKAEPALETWRPDAPAAAGETRKSRSVWILVGGIWISTVTVFAGAIGAILYLLG